MPEDISTTSKPQMSMEILSVLKTVFMWELSGVHLLTCTGLSDNEIQRTCSV